ncbi:FAD-binding molybdopterin dehydrogenase OS=Streptomyces microflavus OX=1919 GN=Smic_00120 PE=4 SV=1 [Streptomyces microflavus]
MATNPSDMAVALAALDATVLLLGPEGERAVPVTEFHRLPGENPDQDTVIRPGELITEVVLPPPAPARPPATARPATAPATPAPLVSVAATLQVDAGVERATFAFGGVAHRPWRARRAEAELLGAPATPAAFQHALIAELAEAQPLRDNAFKVDLVRRVALDVLGELCEPQGRETAPAT